MRSVSPVALNGGATQIETAAPHLDWLSRGIFVSVGGRQASPVIYETYLVA